MKKNILSLAIIILTMAGVVTVWAWLLPFKTITNLLLIELILENSSSYSAILKRQIVQSIQVMAFGVSFLWLVNKKDR